ncbi:hypothetical protein JCM3766R1_005132 [Sporobolomyces carnicolor]
MATVVFPDLSATRLVATLPIEALVRVYARLVSTTSSLNDPSPERLGTRGPITRFHSRVVPPLEVEPYLERLTRFTPFPRDALLLSSIYLNRISHLALETVPGEAHALIPSFEPRTPQPVVLFSPVVLTTSPGSPPPANFTLSSSPPPPPDPPPPPSASDRPPQRQRETSPAPVLNEFTLHRLVLSTLIVANKFLVDGTLSQSRAAKVGGVDTYELAKLERETLRLLSWSLFVDPVELEHVSRVWETEATNLGLLPSPELLLETSESRCPSSASSSVSSSVESTTTTVVTSPPSSPPIQRRGRGDGEETPTTKSFQRINLVATS